MENFLTGLIGWIQSNQAVSDDITLQLFSCDKASEKLFKVKTEKKVPLELKQSTSPPPPLHPTLNPSTLSSQKIN